MNVTTAPMDGHPTVGQATNSVVHAYELAILIRQAGEDEADEFTTTFISRYLSRDTADAEAKIAAEVWGKGIHETCKGTTAIAGPAVYVRQGGKAVCWMNPTTLELQYQHNYRPVSKVTIPKENA
jgi:hypothetical protein